MLIIEDTAKENGQILFARSFRHARVPINEAERHRGQMVPLRLM